MPKQQPPNAEAPVQQGKSAIQLGREENALVNRLRLPVLYRLPQNVVVFALWEKNAFLTWEQVASAQLFLPVKTHHRLNAAESVQ